MRAAVVPTVTRKMGSSRGAGAAAPIRSSSRSTLAEFCYTDVHITEGALPTSFPRTLGHEPVGEIVEIWAGGDFPPGRRPGGCALDSVFSWALEYCLRGKPML